MNLQSINVLQINFEKTRDDYDRLKTIKGEVLQRNSMSMQLKTFEISTGPT